MSKGSRYHYEFIHRLFYRRRTPPDAAHIDIAGVIEVDVKSGDVGCNRFKVEKLWIRLAMQTDGAGRAIRVTKQFARFKQCVLVVGGIKRVRDAPLPQVR